MATSSMSQDRSSQTIVLPDGRKLGYAEFGNPKGYPVLYFHGYPASRLEGTLFPGLVKPTNANLRVLSIDRPGFGISDFQPGRTIADWPRDVESLVKQLGLQRFAVLGLSGGGPYALACANAFFGQQEVGVSGIGVCCGAPPWWAGRGGKEMMWWYRLFQWGCWHCPRVTGWAVGAVIAVSRWFVTTGFGRRFVEKAVEAGGKKRQETEEEQGKKEEEQGKKEEDQGQVSCPENSIQARVDRLLRAVFEPFVQGSEATIQDGRLLSGDNWGFQFEDVQFDKVQIWHGTKDVNAPISMMRYVHERLPHSVMREFETDHGGMVWHLDEILDDLVPAEEMARFEGQGEPVN